MLDSLKTAQAFDQFYKFFVFFSIKRIQSHEKIKIQKLHRTPTLHTQVLVSAVQTLSPAVCHYILPTKQNRIV